MTQGKHSRTAVVSYTEAYPSSLENITVERGLQQCAALQVKAEPTAECDNTDDEDISYDNCDDSYYDHEGGMYTDHGGLFSYTGRFTDDAIQAVQYSKPRLHKVMLVELRGSLSVSK